MNQITVYKKVTQEDTPGPLQVLLRYLGTLPPSIRKVIILPLSIKDNVEFLNLLARENEPSAKKRGYFSYFSLQDDSRGQFQPTFWNKSALRIHRDAYGVGNRGTLTTALTDASPFPVFGSWTTSTIRRLQTLVTFIC